MRMVELVRSARFARSPVRPECGTRCVGQSSTQWTDSRYCLGALIGKRTSDSFESPWMVDVSALRRPTRLVRHDGTCRTSFI